MADEKNAPRVDMPANRMRLSERFKKMKNNINLHFYTEHTEDKGADTEIVEAEKDGVVIGHFIKKDGKTIESRGSADAQQSGDFDAMAKKVGASDAIVHTKPEQVSEVSHDNQEEHAKDNQKAVDGEKSKELPKDNSHEASKEKFVNSSTPKESSKEELKKAKGDDAPVMNYKQINKMPEGESDKSPKLNYTQINKQYPTPKIPKWKENFEKLKAQANVQPRGVVKKPKAPVPAGASKVKVAKSQPLQKKWQVFMESMKQKFADPLQKEPLSKGDVIDFRSKKDTDNDINAIENASSKMSKIKDATKRFVERKNQQEAGEKQPEVADPNHKFWLAYRAQEQKKARQEEAKKIPLPNDPRVEQKKPEASATVLPIKKSEVLAKDSPKLGKLLAPQHLPSAEGGLENHLQNLQVSLKRNEAKLIAAQDKKQYEDDMTKEAREKQMKVAERTHKYLIQGIQLTKTAIAARDNKEPKWSDLIGTGNPKVNHLGILTFGNTLPGHHCPARGDCGDGSCYGMNGQQAMGGALDLRARNSGLVHRPDFAEGAIHALKNAPKHLIMDIDPETYEKAKDMPRFKDILLAEPVHMTKKINKKDKDGNVRTSEHKVVKIKVKAGDYVRWHDTGDILNEKHLDDMVKIAKAFPEKKFYCYTKSMHLGLDKLRALPNFNVVQSLGGKHNDKIDPNKPHAKFFESLDAAKDAGYTDVWHNDWPAATGVTNIALVPHGARMKEINPDQYNNPQQQNPLAPPAKMKKSMVSEHEPHWMLADQPDAVAQSYAMGPSGKMRAMMMVQHPKVEIQEHPKDVIDVEPEIIERMKGRLAEKKPEGQRVPVKDPMDDSVHTTVKKSEELKKDLNNKRNLRWKSNKDSHWIENHPALQAYVMRGNDSPDKSKPYNWDISYLDDYGGEGIDSGWAKTAEEGKNIINNHHAMKIGVYNGEARHAKQEGEKEDSEGDGKESLQKDVVSIKTGKQVKVTDKKIKAQAMAGIGTNAGMPTPTTVKEVDGKVHYSEVSDKIANKFKKMTSAAKDRSKMSSGEKIQSAMETHGQFKGAQTDRENKAYAERVAGKPPQRPSAVKEESLDDKTARVKASLGKINGLMGELRNKVSEDKRPKMKIVKGDK